MVVRQQILRWGWPDLEPRNSYTQRARVTCLAWHPNEHQLAGGDAESDILGWDTLLDGSIPLPARSQHVGSVAYHREGVGFGIRDFVRSQSFRALAFYLNLTGGDVSGNGRWLIHAESCGWHMWDLTGDRELAFVPLPRAVVSWRWGRDLFQHRRIRTGFDPRWPTLVCNCMTRPRTPRATGRSSAGSFRRTAGRVIADFYNTAGCTVQSSTPGVQIIEITPIAPPRPFLGIQRVPEGFQLFTPTIRGPTNGHRILDGSRGLE